MAEGEDGKVIDKICGYCGTAQSQRVKLGVGQAKDEIIWAKPKLADVDREKMYWLIMCQACGTVTGVQYVE